MIRTALLIWREKASVTVCAVGAQESFTETVIADCPAVVGVPESTPVEVLSERPAGTPVLLQVSGVRPPLARKVKL